MPYFIRTGKHRVINIYQLIYHNLSYKHVFITLFITVLSTCGDNSVDNSVVIVSRNVFSLQFTLGEDEQSTVYWTVIERDARYIVEVDLL